MRAFFRRYWFLIAMGFVVPLGLIWPDGGEAISESTIAIPLLVATTLLISGFLLDARRLARQAANLRAILLTLSTTFLVAPVLGYALAFLIGPSLSTPGSGGALFLEAVMVTAAQASTLASALALTIIAGGDRELALVLTLFSNALTVFLTPVILDLSIGAQVSFPVAQMMARMALVVLLPVVLGQVLRRLLARRVSDGWITMLRFVPQLIMLCFIYTGFANARDELQDESLIALRLLAVAALLHGGLLLWTRGLSKLLRLPEPARVAVILSGSQKTLPNGLYVWKGFFAGNPYCPVALVLYHLFQLVIDTLFLPRLTGRKSPRQRGKSS